MGTFTFHSWLICEIFTDNGLVGVGNAALSPLISKQVIDLCLKPLLIGADPWNVEFLWQQYTARPWPSDARASAWWPSAPWTSRYGTFSANLRSSPFIDCWAAGPNRASRFMPAAFTARR